MQHRSSAFIAYRATPASRRLIFIRPGGTRHLLAVSMRPPVRIPLSRPRFMPVPARERRRTFRSNGSERHHPVPFCAPPMAREMYVARPGMVFISDAIFAPRPCALGRRLIYSNRKGDERGNARSVRECDPMISNHAGDLEPSARLTWRTV